MTAAKSENGTTATAPRERGLVGEIVPEFAALCALGVVVALLMLVLGHHEPLQSMDRAAGDYLMREVARSRLANDAEIGPRTMFVSVSEQTCEKWAEVQGRGCTVGFSAPRGELAKLVQAIAAVKPALLVLDFDLSPNLRMGGPAGLDASDTALCDAVRDATKAFPVIVPSPLVPGNGPARLARSLLGKDCFGEGANPVRFASPLFRADADGVVREVQAWMTVENRRLFGVGFLAAAMLSSVTRDEITCFDAKPSCEHAIDLGDPPYRPQPGGGEAYQRIQFTLPWHAPENHEKDAIGYSPDRFDVVEALDLSRSIQRLAGAAVFLGASYPASGDLHQTPIGGGMPGSVVHANAMSAFSRNLVVKEGLDVWLKVILVVSAAAMGVAFHLGACALRRPGWQRILAGLVSVVGVFLNIVVVLLIASFWAEWRLQDSGKMVGAVTPALAVAFEGFAELATQIKDAVKEALVGWRTRSAEHRSLLLVVWTILGFAAVQDSAWAEGQDASSLKQCAPAPGLKARVADMTADADEVPRAWVRRDNDRFPARADCLLRIGDRLQAEGSTRVDVMLPDHTVTTVLAADPPFVVKGLGPTGVLDRAVELIRLFGDPDLSETQAAARIHSGISRGTGQAAPPALSPPVPAVRQRVSLGNPFLLRWEGAGPFALVVRDRAEHEAVVTTAATTAELPLAGLVAGPALLRLEGADGSTETAIELVPDAAIPVVPGQSDVPDVARSVWLLLRASAAWKLEAMSRILLLARRGDPVAGAIVGGAP